MDNMSDSNNQMIERNQSIIDSMTLDVVEKTLNKINAFHAIVKATLIPGTDYGIIPGTKRPTLFKSGAENILMLFGLLTSVEIVTSIPIQLTRETNFVSYTVKCRLVKNGEIISEGIGTCNSGEKKYSYANALDIANTIMKMASKRALVDAVLHVASLSAVFAEDAEDMENYLTKESLDNIDVATASAYKINIGKHKGKTAGEVYKSDPEYVKWFFANGRDDKIRRVFEVLAEAVKAQFEAKKKKEQEGFDDGNNGSTCMDIRVDSDNSGALDTDNAQGLE